MTYDIEAPGPWHNFMANGAIVHNSYNEESGRYKQLDPVFYIPARDRELIQIVKPGAYEFIPGDDVQYARVSSALRETCQVAYNRYEELLELGIAREVARMALPLNIMSSCYVTTNLRGLMSFLSLRPHSRLLLPRPDQ